MVLPCIHSNGTTRDALVEQQLAVLRHLRDAEVALQEAGPNGRDYYPLGQDALRLATAEHRDRLDKLSALIHEIEEHAEGISNSEPDATPVPPKDWAPSPAAG